MAVAHREAVAPAEHRDSYIRVVIRHEMKRPPHPPDAADQCGALFTSSNYLRAVLPGEAVTGRAGRPLRVPPGVAAPFLA